MRGVGETARFVARKRWGRSNCFVADDHTDDIDDDDDCSEDLSV